MDKDGSDDRLNRALSLLSSSGLDGALIVVDRILEKEEDSWEACGAKADILHLEGTSGLGTIRGWPWEYSSRDP